MIRMMMKIVCKLRSLASGMSPEWIVAMSSLCVIKCIGKAIGLIPSNEDKRQDMIQQPLMAAQREEQTTYDETDKERSEARHKEETPKPKRKTSRRLSGDVPQCKCAAVRKRQKQSQ